MDLNYDVKTWVVSLQTACMVKLSHQILSASELLPANVNRPDFVMDEFGKRVDTLHIPKRLRAKIRQLIRPVTEDLILWYNILLFPHRFPPTLTQYGTVDMTKSIASLMQTDLDVEYRYDLACSYCLEEHIFRLGHEMTMTDLFVEDYISDCIYAGHALSQFWYYVHHRKFNKCLGRDDLTEVQNLEGLSYAIIDGNQVAVKYFLEKFSVRSVSLRHAPSCFLQTRNFWSATSVSLLYAKVKHDQQTRMLSIFSVDMLMALLRWPYQDLFMEAATSLMQHLDALHFWGIVKEISNRELHAHIDYDYARLLAGFLELRPYQGIKRNTNLPLERIKFIKGSDLKGIPTYEEQYSSSTMKAQKFNV